MTRTALPYSAPDLSALARLLERALLDHQVTHGRLPGHVEMMNLLARGAGHRNLQALQAATVPMPAPVIAPTVVADAWFDAPEIAEPALPAAPAAPVLSAHAKKALEQFDAAGRLAHWPPKLSVQRLVMWVLWTRFDARRVYTEADVNRILKGWHTWGDHVTLRRELINHRLMTRKSDCSEYRKTPQWPDDEAQGLLRALRKRQAPYRLSNRPPRELPRPAEPTSRVSG